jgi:DinB superfamily
MTRPSRDEYVEYYDLYVRRVPDGDVVDTLESQRADMGSRLRAISEQRGDHRYAEGKWTVKELLGHIVDTERILGTRALAFARGDETPLPGFDQDVYVAGANFADRTIADLTEEFLSLRTSHIVLFRSLDDGTWMRRGTAGGYEFTTRAIAWIMEGHVLHHTAVLEERYLDG